MFRIDKSVKRILTYVNRNTKHILVYVKGNDDDDYKKGGTLSPVKEKRIRIFLFSRQGTVNFREIVCVL